MNWKKIWYFIWKDDSMASWLVNVIIAIILVKFVIYPGLGLLLGTGFPVVAVVSCSMEHKTTDCDNPNQVPNLCGIAGVENIDFDVFWKTCGGWYENKDISKNMFEEFRFKNGFNKGDIMVLVGSKNIQIHPRHSEVGWKVTLVDTGTNAMTGARVKRIEKYIDEETFMLTYGDGVTDLNKVNLTNLLDVDLVKSADPRNFLFQLFQLKVGQDKPYQKWKVSEIAKSKANVIAFLKDLEEAGIIMRTQKSLIAGLYKYTTKSIPDKLEGFKIFHPTNAALGKPYSAVDVIFMIAQGDLRTGKSTGWYEQAKAADAVKAWVEDAKEVLEMFQKGATQLQNVFDIKITHLNPNSSEHASGAFNMYSGTGYNNTYNTKSIGSFLFNLAHNSVGNSRPDKTKGFTNVTGLLNELPKIKKILDYIAKNKGTVPADLNAVYQEINGNNQGALGVGKLLLAKLDKNGNYDSTNKISSEKDLTATHDLIWTIWDALEKTTKILDANGNEIPRPPMTIR